MDQAALRPDFDFETVDLEEQRSARRYSLLIRPAKLVCSQGEFICVLRDVSRTGVSAKLFHRLPNCRSYLLELQSGQSYAMQQVWERDGEAGFEFDTNVDVSQVVSEASAYPKRGLRLGLQFPVAVSSLTARGTATIENISQQGARIETSELFAIDQSIRLESEALRETRAKIRWRRDAHYGVVFDDTFSLRDFAELAARLQAPALLY